MQDLTTGSVSRHLLQTMSFMLVSMVFQTLYVLVDLYWVGRLGTQAVAAVAISGNLMFVVLAITQMLGVGTTTFVSHAAGAKDRDRALLVFNQSQVLSIVAGLVFLVAGMALRNVFATAMSADAVTAGLVADYLLWFVPAMALQFGMVGMSAALRGIGLFKPGMVVQTATIIINIVLAPIFIFGWGIGRAFGVAGAAIATFLSILIGTVWLLTYFKPTAYLHFMVADWKPRLKLWADMLKIGLPAGAEFGLMAVYLALIYNVTRPFGAAAQAGFGIGLRIVQAAFLPVVALGFSVAPVAGQNFGARRGDRVRATFRTAAWMSVAMMGVVIVFTHLFPGELIRIFSADPAVIEVGEVYLRIVSWNFVASGLVFVSSSMFQAIGNTMPSLMTSFTRIVIIALPLIFLSKLPGFRLEWIWWLSVAAVTLQMGLNLWLLQREFDRRLQFAPAPGPPLAQAPAPTVVEG
jgi:putative MATE family efflux protein